MEGHWHGRHTDSPVLYRSVPQQELGPGVRGRAARGEGEQQDRHTRVLSWLGGVCPYSIAVSVECWAATSRG